MELLPSHPKSSIKGVKMKKLKWIKENDKVVCLELEDGEWVPYKGERPEDSKFSNQSPDQKHNMIFRGLPNGR